MTGDPDLARRLESFQADVGAELGREVLAAGGGTAVFAGVGSPVAQAIGVDGDVDTWARVAAEGFATPEMSIEFLVDVMTPFGHARQARCYLAYVDGQPAGSASMFVSQERKVVGLFGAATRPQFRRRGIQAAFLQRRLADAAKEGCDIAMVTTLPGSDSHRNVARRGFELMYTKISMRLDIAARRT